MLGNFSFLLPSREFKAMCETAHEFIDYYIDKALAIEREEKVAGKKDGEKERKTLLQLTAEQTQDQTELRSQILQGIMAGQDTTSVLLANTIFLLFRHPDMWTRLRTEVLEMGDREVTFDSLKTLKFLQNVLAECKSPPFPRLMNGRCFH
jgi:cytochrome P450